MSFCSVAEGLGFSPVTERIIVSRIPGYEMTADLDLERGK